MLSLQIKPINNASQTVRYYFSQDNYYFTGELSTQWQGLSADKQNLVGDIHANELEAILGGMLPSGDVIGFKSQSGEIKHRGGYDLTFSAPKSVSYLALVCGHKEFIDLHVNAVKTVLTLIEKEAAEARKSGKDGMEYEKTGNLCFATILHDTSREQDPHLHVHGLMMNFTERLDGKWRALASDISRNHGTMEWIMNNQIFLGLVYRSEIALGLKNMGLEIEHTGDAHGLFEIKHFDKELMRSLSKRRNQIEDRADGMHSKSLKAYDRATLDTRKPKEATTPEVLRERWKNESAALGVESSTYLADLKERTLATKTTEELTRPTAEVPMGVKEAIAHLEEKKLHFSYQDILQTSLHFSLGHSEITSLIKQIDAEISTHNLIALDADDTQFTTPGLLAKERCLIDKISSFTAQKHPLGEDKAKIAALTDNQSIQRAIVQAMSSKEGVVRIKQQSGVSREALKALIDYAESDKKIRVLNPSSLSVLSINKDSHKSPTSAWQWLMSIGKSELCETVAGFNYRHEQDFRLPFFKSKKERELLIVDEAQRLSPDELNKLLTIADKSCAKVILLEKAQSLSGFKSDLPDLLTKTCVKTFEVEDKLIRTNNISLVEAREKDARLLKTAAIYSSIPLHERKSTRVLTLSKQEANQVNDAIRTKLKEQGEILNDEKIIPTLVRVSLTEPEKKLAKNYQTDWVLMKSTRNDVKKLTIIGINERDNFLSVRDQYGVISHLPAKQMTQSTQAYEQKSLPVGVGDKLIATGNRLREGIKLGTQYQVAGLTRHGIKLKDGKNTIHLTTEANNHLPFNYDYAKTIYANDYKPVDKTIITLPAHALRQNTLSLLAESTKQELTIVTDNVSKANRYALKSASNASAISITLDAAHTNHGVQVIDNATTTQLVSTLEQALTLLSNEKPVKSDSEKALQYAIAHLSEREAAFKRTDLLKVALEKAIGHFGLHDLDAVLDQVIGRGDLIVGRDLLTTKEAVGFETSILNVVRDGVNSLKPLLTVEEARQQLARTTLTKGQKQACELVTTSPDRFTMIQGYAGTGKTTMSKSIIDSIEYANSLVPGGIEIIAVAPTHQAAKEMKALGIEAQTLKSFLIEQEQAPTLTERSLVILDESSMVSNRDCASLLQRIDAAGARCTLLGDVSQHQSIESGKPSKLLMQEGSIRVACMDDIVRQQVLSYKTAIETLIAGDTNKALQELGALPLMAIERKHADSPYHEIQSSVFEVGSSSSDKQEISLKHPAPDSGLKISPFNNKSPIDMAVGDYLSRTPDVRDKTIVIIHENKKRDVANNQIRTALMKESTLGSENKLFPRLVSTNYTTAELYHCETYRDCLTEESTHFLKRGEQYYKVANVDTTAKVVLLQDSQGKETIFMPEKESKDWKVELFQLKPGELSVGEKIHFKKSDKELGRFANERLVVTDVKEESFMVKDNSGTEHLMKKKDMQDCHWDYSYTSTSYSIQGASSPYVIGVAETGNDKVNHWRSFYIMVTRGSLHAMIYTDNYNKLKKQLSVIPEKTSALESLTSLKQNNENKLSPNSTSKSLTENGVEVRTEAHHKTTNIKYDANTIVQNLTFSAELVIESLLGEPNRALSSKSEYRYGRNGSLSCCLSGEKRGTWFNFETSEKGNLLHLIQKTLNMDFKESLVYAAKLTGDDLKESIKLHSIKPQEPKENTSNKPSKTQAYGLQLARESQPIAGTVAARYLKEIRGIHDLSGENIRFHPHVYTHKSEQVKHRPALLNIVRDQHNVVVAVEAIFLDSETAKKALMDIKSKKTYGPKEGAGVILNAGQGPESVTYIAEGVETGLSIRDAVKNERVIATLGKQNFKNIDMELITDRVVLCLDNDGKSIKDDKVIIDTIERLKQHGKTVEIAIPERVKDFNDIAVTQGIKGVINTLNKAVNVDKILSVSNKIDMNQEQIKTCLEQISRQTKFEKPEKIEKTTIVTEQYKILERVEREIY